MTEKEINDKTLKLAKDLAKYQGTSVNEQMVRFNGSLFTGTFKGLEKFGIYPDKRCHK